MALEKMKGGQGRVSSIWWVLDVGMRVCQKREEEWWQRVFNRITSTSVALYRTGAGRSFDKVQVSQSNSSTTANRCHSSPTVMRRAVWTWNSSDSELNILSLALWRSTFTFCSHTTPGSYCLTVSLWATGGTKAHSCQDDREMGEKALTRELLRVESH